MENNKGAEGVQKALAPEKEEAACFRRTVREEATFMESAKDRLRQFKEAPAMEHWACLKNTVRAMFGEPKIGSSAIDGGVKDDSKKMAPSVES